MTLKFLSAKAHANHSRSPTLSQVTQMLNATSVNDVENILQSTSYGEIINKARPSVDFAEFERELRRNFASLLFLYMRTAPEGLANLLHAYAIILDAENINLILQAIINNSVNEDLETIITPIEKMDHYKRMMGAATAEFASDFIPYPTVRRAVQKALKISDDPSDKVFYLSSALSHSSFAILNKLAPKLMRKEVELLNLETVCRAINLGIDARPWMIPNRGVVNRNIQQLNAMKTPREAINYIMPQFPVKSPLRMALAAEDNDVVAVLEDTALSYLYARHHHRFFVSGDGEGGLLSFFAIKKAELEDITRLVFSKIKGIPSEDIRDMLYPIYSNK